MDTCPKCGYCPTCKRSAEPVFIPTVFGPASDDRAKFHYQTVSGVSITDNFNGTTKSLAFTKENVS